MTEPVEASAPSSFLDSLGDRGWRRAEPRTSIALAGAGCALGVLGVLVVAGDTGLDDSSGDLNRVPGLLLSALVVAAGFFVVARARQGAVATAGAAAAALGVPPFMFFLTFDGGSLPPYSTEGILLVSTGTWLATFAVGPARGRPFFLGAGLIGLWATILQVTEKLFDAPFRAAESFFGTSSSSSFDPETGELIDPGFSFGNGPRYDPPDPATVGLLSLALGVAFLLTGRGLDKQGRHGVATPFALAALPALLVGVIGLAPDLEASGTGLLMVLIGLALAWHGATVWRRVTTWVGGATVALGLAIFLGDMAGDSATVGGMLFIAGGIAMVFGGHAIAAAMQEPDEMAVTVGGGPMAPSGPRRRVTPLVPSEPSSSGPAADDTQWAPPPASGPPGMGASVDRPIPPPPQPATKVDPAPAVPPVPPPPAAPGLSSEVAPPPPTGAQPIPPPPPPPADGPAIPPPPPA